MGGVRRWIQFSSSPSFAARLDGLPLSASLVEDAPPSSATMGRAAARGPVLTSPLAPHPWQSGPVRWRFPDPNDVSETERRTALLLASDRFWQQFSRAAPEISQTFSRKAEFDIADFMHRHLGPIDPRLLWE